MALLLALAWSGSGLAQAPHELDDGSDVFYQEYLNRLVEDLRLSQIQELAQDWGLVVGGRRVRLDRSFWEDRLRLNLWMALMPGNDNQTVSIEYRIRPRWLLRGEVSRRSSHHEAWLDCIFHFEY